MGQPHLKTSEYAAPYKHFQTFTHTFTTDTSETICTITGWVGRKISLVVDTANVMLDFDRAASREGTNAWESMLIKFGETYSDDDLVINTEGSNGGTVRGIVETAGQRPVVRGIVWGSDFV